MPLARIRHLPPPLRRLLEPLVSQEPAAQLIRSRATQQWRQLLEPPLPQSAVLLGLKGMVPRELGALRL